MSGYVSDRVPDQDGRQRMMPWIVVAVLVTGVVVTAIGIVLGALVPALIGVVLILGAVVGAVLLPRAGLGAAISFTLDYPETTHGPRATEHGDTSRIDTDPHARHRPRLPYEKFSEVSAEELPEGPDRQRVFPQHVNLGPEERLRVVGDEQVVEMPEEPED